MPQSSAHPLWTACQTDYQFEGFNHGPDIRPTFTGDVERRTVGRSRNRYPQPAGYCDSAMKPHEFHRDLTLVVVHGHDRVKYSIL